jgi:hypothetical protein
MKRGHISMSSAGYEHTIPMNGQLISTDSCVTGISYLNDMLRGTVKFHEYLPKPCPWETNVLFQVWNWLTLSFSVALQHFEPWPLFQVLNPIHTVRLLGLGISPSQGLYLHTEQQKHGTNAHRHPCLEWDSNPRTQCSSGRRWFMPYTAWTLWST